MYQQHLYKQQLYNTLSNDQGLVDNVKLQLRQKIINKLKTSNNALGNKNVQPEKEFVRKVCLSLFNEFLTAERLFHTLAVFSPEAGISKGVLKVQELRQLLKLSPQDSSSSSLQQIINSYLPRSRLTSPLVSTSAQTDDKQTILNLQSKLANIQFQYKQKSLQTMKSVETTQQRLIKYKNEMNKRCKEEVQLQIKRMRDFQIVKVRMEEQEKCKLNMRDYQEELEISYQAKLEKLRQRQAEVITRVATKMKQVETYNYQMRQNVLKDFELVKAKQQQLDRLKQQLQQQQRRNIEGPR